MAIDVAAIKTIKQTRNDFGNGLERLVAALVADGILREQQTRSDCSRATNGGIVVVEVDGCAVAYKLVQRMALEVE